MTRVHLKPLGAVLLAGLAWIPSAHAWGCEGHRTVALIAEKHLTLAAKQKFLTLLQNNPIDPQLKRFCGGTGLGLFADSSTWADDVRQKGRDDGWHFIDIPRGAPRESSTFEKACAAPQSCATEAIQKQLAILRDATGPGQQRANALRYLIHLVGDLHQPLHATTNSDRGGNCVPVKYFGANPHLKSPQDQSYTPNLHGIWDKEIVETDMNHRDVEQYANNLDAEFQPEMASWQQEGINPDDWAWESHEHAEETAYGALPKKIAIEPEVPVNTCADNHGISKRMLHKHIAVGQIYQDEAGLVVRERLAQAGVRLAMILNQAAQ